MASTARRTAMAAGVAVMFGATIDWVSARDSRPREGLSHTSVTALFRWSYEQDAPLPRSFAMVVLVSGTLVLLGAIVYSRVLAAGFSVLALIAAGLWIGLNASHYRPIDLRYTDLRAGVWVTVVGGLIGLATGLALHRPEPAEKKAAEKKSAEKKSESEES